MNYVTKKDFQELEKRVAKLESSGKSAKTKERPIKIREFILEKKPKSNLDKAICLVYFLEEYESENYREGINSNDLKAAFQKAREKVPKNPPDVLSKCAKKGWIDQTNRVDGMIKWKLTNTGVDYVKSFLGENGDDRSIS